MNVALIEPSKTSSESFVIYPMSQDYRIDSLVLRRLEVLAEVVGMRVIAVETPAITMNFEDPELTLPSSLPFPIWTRVLFGRFQYLAAIQMEAVSEVTGVALGEAHLIGESFGAQLVAALATLGPPISLDLVEPVNCRGRSVVYLRSLSKKLTGVETERKLAYVARNREEGWGDFRPFELSSVGAKRVDDHLKRFGNQGRWALVGAIGLGSGIGATLEQMKGRRRVRIWRGAESSACSSSDVSGLAERYGGRIAVMEYVLSLRDRPAGHHVLSDFDAMVGFGLKLRENWSRDALLGDSAPSES